jgi:hypothetical protein
LTSVLTNVILKKKGGLNNMKRKTIVKQLRNKLKEFLESIDDEDLRSELELNIIVTGGCITSMLLNEKVNDYDIYIKDKVVLGKLINYYINKINKKYPYYTIESIEKDERFFIKIKSDGVIEESLKLEKTENPTYDVLFVSSNAITLSDKIQIVVRFFGNPEQIHENFDYIHCTCYWKSWDNELVLPPRALEAIINKELVYSGSKYPICSIIRSRKFIKRDWQITAGQYLKMVFDCNKLDLEDVDTLQDQLMGVDSAFFNELIRYIDRQRKDNENFVVNSSVVLDMIDEIF